MPAGADIVPHIFFFLTDNIVSRMFDSPPSEFLSDQTSGMFVVINKNNWNALPPDIQNIIEKVNEDWIEKQGKAWDEIDKEDRDDTLKLGNKIISLSKEENERWAKPDCNEKSKRRDQRRVS